jgi:hypothetical protein
VQVELLGSRAVDCLQETDKLLGAMSRPAFAYDLAGPHIQGGLPGAELM